MRTIKDEQGFNCGLMIFILQRALFLSHGSVLWAKCRLSGGSERVPVSVLMSLRGSLFSPGLLLS